MRDHSQTGPETRQRLLEAAGDVFAEHGFRAATIRDICERAHANIAAVNYHFGDKEGLYKTALQHWLGAAMQKYPPDGGLGADAPAEQRLRAFIRSFLYRILDEGRPAWHGKLMAREMTEPTAALEQIIETIIRPMLALLVQILADLLGPTAREETIRLSGQSIVGQCLFYNHARSVLARLGTGTFTHEDIERISDHITRFSLAALREVAREREGTA